MTVAPTPEQVLRALGAFRYFTFEQNNSGGDFDIDPDRGIAATVIIEATTHAEALARAEKIGLYFDGVAEEIDCECCGDRWERLGYDASPDGDDEPNVSGGYFAKPSSGVRADSDSHGPGLYIHRADGTVEGYHYTASGYRLAG